MAEANEVHRSRLFFGICLALIPTGASFALVSNILVPLKQQFILTNYQVGLIGGAALWFAFGIGVAAPRVSFPLPWLIAAGLLVGFGTRLGSGCTSGHGICGLARFSRRSLVAVLAFMGAGVATVYALRHVLGVLA